MRIEYFVQSEYNGCEIQQIMRREFKMSTTWVKRVKLYGTVDLNGVHARVKDRVQTGDLLLFEYEDNSEKLTPPETKLTSFSVLMARHKGDIDAFRTGAKALLALSPTARVLIAEACSHIPQNEDIGRVKLPRLLRGKLGKGLQIDVVGGNDFPDDLTPYDIVIHCGACMFNRRAVLSRVRRARVQDVPITNYGIAIAALSGILDRVVM